MKQITKSKISVNDPQIIKAYASKWLIRILDHDIDYNDEFFKCADYCANGLKSLVEVVVGELKSAKIPKNTITNLTTCSKTLLPDTLESIMEDYPFLKGHVKNFIRQELANQIIKEHSISKRSRPLSQLKQIFSLTEKEIELCYFVFLSEEFEAIKDFFKVELELFRYDRIDVLADMLDIGVDECKKSINKLQNIGIIRESHTWPVLSKNIENSLKGFPDTDIRKLLCSPLGKSDVDLADFPLNRDDVEYVLKLLGKRHHNPVHILLYGPCGVGKSSFARALAKHLKLKAFEVVNGHNTDTSDRKASLVACLNSAKSMPTSLVVVDEGDSLLDVLTDDYSHGTSSKAWLNALMEQGDNRVIWIVNSTSYIDPSVKRRFSYSIYFQNLTVDQQVNMWAKIIKKYHVENRISLEDAKRFAIEYSAPIS